MTAHPREFTGPDEQMCLPGERQREDDEVGVGQQGAQFSYGGDPAQSGIHPAVAANGPDPSGGSHGRA